MAIDSTFIPPAYTAGIKPGLGKDELEKAELKQACKLFESYFLKQVLSGMRKTLQGDSLFGDSNAQNIYTDMLDQAYADEAASGQGVGLSAVLEQQLSRQAPARPSANRMPGYSSGGGVLGSETGTVRSSFEMPLEDAAISSAFGTRVHPVTGEVHQHSGVDLAAAEGTDITAAADGTVSFSGEKGGYGNLVVIDHADGSQTYYGHCSRLMVEQGQTVNRGEVIAQVGSTGVSTGPHLHFEVRDASGEPQDPMPMLATGLDLTA